LDSQILDSLNSPPSFGIFICQLALRVVYGRIETAASTSA